MNWSRYRDPNSVPTSPLTDDLATTPSGLVLCSLRMLLLLVDGVVLFDVVGFDIVSCWLSLHDWCNKGCGMCYPVCGMVHIKEPLLLIDKSSLCGGIGFPFSLSEWSLTICLTPYNRRWNVLSASLNKTFLSLSLSLSVSLSLSLSVCFLVVCVVDFASFFFFLNKPTTTKQKKAKINKQHMSIMNCLWTYHHSPKSVTGSIISYRG